MSNHNDKNKSNSGKLLTSNVEDNPEPSEIPIPYSNKNPIKKIQTAKASKYPQGYFREKVCRMCNKMFTPNAPSEKYCDDYCKDRAVSERYLMRNYKVTLEQYELIYTRAEGRCQICGEVGFKMKETHQVLLCLDHDHNTGKARGLLCHNCNRALGLFKDSKINIQNALKYLEGATTIPDGSTL